MRFSKIDTSSELILARVKQGVKLVRPDKKLNFKKSSDLSVVKIMQLPVAVYFEDSQHRTMICNEETVEECGFISMKDCIGVPWFRPFREESVIQSVLNDKRVVKKQTLEIFEEIAIRKDQINVHTLSIRMPWYDEDDKIIGLFGCSIVLGKHSLSSSLMQMVGLGLLQPAEIYNSHKYSYLKSDCLSKRESEYLGFTVKGMSSKEIAKILNISPRTAEKHQANINKKLGCKTKYELISFIANN